MKPIFFILFLCIFHFANIGYSQSCDSIIISNRVSTKFPNCGSNNGEIIIINTTGGLSPYSYQLNGESTSTGAFFNLELGIYTLITSDARSCADTSYIDLLTKDLDILIKPDNAFSPNGDNIHDTWRIPGIENFKLAQVRVFNRWGQIVHINSPYLNSLGWDGQQNGKDVTEGTYYYIISVVDNCIDEHISGTVNIIR